MLVISFVKGVRSQSGAMAQPTLAQVAVWPWVI